jgi:uncharacterized protein (DUF924 family)
MATAADVLEFWFGELDENGRADEAHRTSWWKKSADFDAEIRDLFGATYEDAAAGRLEGWRETPEGTLALVIVLDQFSRNMFRDTPRMYATDEQAVDVALGAVDAGVDQALPAQQRFFLYMPLMHVEDEAHQRRCVTLFETLRDDTQEDAAGPMDSVGFAVSHRDIVLRFGRFPHRNEILGRESSEEELAFLKEPGSSF